MNRPLAPSGAQSEISHGEHRVVVVEVGGGLRTYTLGDWHVLDGYDEMEMASGGRGQPLMPWPNRLRDGAYEFDGQRYQLALSEPDTSTAIHGLVRWANWTVAQRDGAHLRMEHVLHPQTGYPFALELAIDYRLDDDGLTVQMSATNAGSQPCPFGAGVHPYLSAGTETVDTCTLQAPGARQLRADERSVPVGSDPVDEHSDFRAPREIGATKLDTGYFELARDGDGRARARLADPRSGREVTLWQDEAFAYQQVFTGDTLTPARRRQGVAIEPMTCPADAFNSGDGLITLAPGQTFTGSWGITPSP